MAIALYMKQQKQKQNFIKFYTYKLLNKKKFLKESFFEKIVFKKTIFSNPAMMSSGHLFKFQ